MKTTKDYLLLSAAIAIGIIIGGSVLLLIGKSIHKNTMKERMEMSVNYGPRFGYEDHFVRGKYERAGNFDKMGMKREVMIKKGLPARDGRTSIKGKASTKGVAYGNLQSGMPAMPRMLSQLDLTDDQQEQIDVIMEKRQKKIDQMQELRESRWEASTKEIRDILTDEQREEYDKIMIKPGKKNHAPGYYFTLNRFDLTDNQKEKIEVLQKRNDDMRDGMWKSMKQNWDSTVKEIKSVLTDEQKKKFMKIPMFKGKS